MPTVIRLQRGGRTHSPYYRVVVQDSRQRTGGRVIDQLGVYHPCAQPEPRAEVDRAKALKWLRDGAQVSDTARSVLSASGVMRAFAEGKKPEDLAPAPAEPSTAPAVETAAKTAAPPAAEPAGSAPAEPSAAAQSASADAPPAPGAAE